MFDYEYNKWGLIRLVQFSCIFVSQYEIVPSYLCVFLRFLIFASTVQASILLIRDEISIDLLQNIHLFLSFHISHRRIEGNISHSLLYTFEFICLGQLLRCSKRVARNANCKLSLLHNPIQHSLEKGQLNNKYSSVCDACSQRGHLVGPSKPISVNRSIVNILFYTVVQRKIPALGRHVKLEHKLGGMSIMCY